jgi:hypothetical protein
MAAWMQKPLPLIKQAIEERMPSAEAGKEAQTREVFGKPISEHTTQVQILVILLTDRGGAVGFYADYSASMNGGLNVQSNIEPCQAGKKHGLRKERYSTVRPEIMKKSRITAKSYQALLQKNSLPPSPRKCTRCTTDQGVKIHIGTAYPLFPYAHS